MKNNNTYIFALTLVATLGGLLFGYDTAVISGTVESLRKFFIEPQGLPLDQANALEGFVVSSALIGCILGASFAGWISQRYGRKPTLILAAILFLLSAIGSAWPELFVGMPGSGDYTFMYAFVAYRILGGIGVGLASMVSPMYIAEVAPADRRGNLVAWNQFAIIFGMLVVYFVNYTIALQGDAAWLHTIGWRWMFASEIIPAVLFLSFLMFVPETPRYLVMRGRTEKALGVLSHLMDREDAGRELEDIRNSFKEKAPSMKPYFQFMGTWLALFLIGYGLLSWAGNTNALEIALLASFCIALLFPIRSFGVLIILVGVLLSGFQQFVGINVVLYYAPEIFKTMGSGHGRRPFATDRGRGGEPVVYRIGYFYGGQVRTPSVDDDWGARHGGIYVDLGNYFLHPFGGYGIVGLHAGLYGGIRYVVGTGLLGVAGRDLPELDPLHGDEYCGGGPMDRQLLGVMDLPDAG